MELQNSHPPQRTDSDTTPPEQETTTNYPRDLGILDVAALIINKQIGNGIFTTPGLVLGLTGSKTISTALWFVGGLWAILRYMCSPTIHPALLTLISVLVYVEFGAAFPFNGGDLIYVGVNLPFESEVAYFA